MNKQDNKLALSVLATLTAAIALIYTLIMYYHIIFAVIGMSLLFLITAFILTRNLITFSTMKNKSLNVQLKNYIDDVSAQLETMSGAQSQIGKATYLYTKQAAQAVTTLENNYIESQEALYKNLASLSNAQIKTSKLIIRNDQNNAIKITTTIKDMNNQLKDTMIQGFDQIQPDHPELVTTLEEIVHCLKKQPDEINSELQLQLNNITLELQKILNSIQQIPTTAAIQTVPTAMSPLAETDSTIDITSVGEPDSTAGIPPIEEPDFAVNIPAAEDTDSTKDIAPTEKLDSAMDITPVKDADSTVDIPSTDKLDFTIDIATVEETDATVDIPSTEEEASSDHLSWAVEASPTIDITTTEEDTLSLMDTTPIETAFPETESLSIDEPTAILQAETDQTAANNDSNTDSSRQMSADEIAALFAASDPAPKRKASSKNSGTEANLEPTQLEPDSAPTDLNRQLSANEIAALFATMG